MRMGLFDRVLIGTALAAAAVTMLIFFAPDRFEALLPAPSTGDDRPNALLAPPPQTTAANNKAPAPAAPTLPPKQTSVSSPGPSAPAQSNVDAAIGEKLRVLVTSNELDRHIDWPADRKAVASFYAAREFAPIWIHDGKLTDPGKAAIARLQNAAAEGLVAADYPVPNFAMDAGARALAEGDVRLTNSVLDFIRHLAVGRIAPRHVVAQIEYGKHAPDPADILKTITAASDINAVLNQYDPPAQGFRALKAKLVELHSQGDAGNRVVDTVIANMERWRWLPRDLGRTYVMVNIPDYTLQLVHGDRIVWRTKVVVGRVATPTPLMSAPMQAVIVNPSWTVPQSIIQNELLPAYRTDPNIFERMGLEVRESPEGHIDVVQPPGAANALGRIKFAFPNRFQVYLHDTPQKRLFASARRAFSHGCLRVQDPTRLGELILGLAMNGRTPTARELRALFGDGERDFKLLKPPMVHLTYQTAFVDETGQLQLRDDIYGFDARIRAILHGDQRRVADVAPPADAKRDPKRDLAMGRSSQEILRRVERREALNPFGFFDQLFR